MAEDKSRTVKAKSLAKAFLATKPEEEEKPRVREIKERKPVAKPEAKPVVKAADIAAVARMRGQVDKPEEKVEVKEVVKESSIKKENVAEVCMTPVVIRTKRLAEGGVVKKLPACKMAVPRKLPSEEMLIIAAKRKASAKRIPVPMEVVKKAVPVVVAEPVKEASAAEVKEEVKAAPVAEKEVKAEAAKVKAKKEAVKKEAPKKVAKAAPKKEVAKEAPKKEVAKKAPAKAEPKKAEPAKKAVAKSEAVKNTYIEFQSVQYHEEAILKMAEKVWTKDLKNKLADLKSMELYVKPEEKMVYYVFNKKVTGGFEL